MAQLLAVGLYSGEVALYRLWGAKGSEPLRIISLADWGFEPEVTGSVADLQWSADNRALAVKPYRAFPYCNEHLNMPSGVMLWQLSASEAPIARLGCAEHTAGA